MYVKRPTLGCQEVSRARRIHACEGEKCDIFARTSTYRRRLKLAVPRRYAPMAASRDFRPARRAGSPLIPDSPPDMVGSCLVCFQGVSGCRPGVTHDMIGHRTGSRAPSLRVSAAVRCQLWLFSGRRRHGQAWQLGRVAYKPMLQAGLLCSIRLGSQRQYPLPRPEQQLV